MCENPFRIDSRNPKALNVPGREDKNRVVRSTLPCVPRITTIGHDKCHRPAGLSTRPMWPGSIADWHLTTRAGLEPIQLLTIAGKSVIKKCLKRPNFNWDSCFIRAITQIKISQKSGILFVRLSFRGRIVPLYYPRYQILFVSRGRDAKLISYFFSYHFGDVVLFQVRD